MTSILKILAINHLNDNLPKEITELINGFVFYDIEQFNIRIKQYTNQYHQSLLRSEYYPEINGHWGIQFHDVLPNGECLQLQPTNCKKCGNYKRSITNVTLHHNTTCKCV